MVQAAGIVAGIVDTAVWAVGMTGMVLPVAGSERCFYLSGSLLHLTTDH